MSKLSALYMVRTRARYKTLPNQTTKFFKENKTVYHDLLAIQKKQRTCSFFTHEKFFSNKKKWNLKFQRAMYWIFHSWVLQGKRLVM